MEKNKLDTTNIYPYYAGIGVESDQSREQFLANLKLLPQSLTDFLVSDETADLIGNISEHYDLTDVQTELISWLIRKVATGDEYIKDLPTSISSLVGIGIEQSTEIYNYLIKSVFAPYWEDIKKIQIQKFGLEQTSSQTTSQVAKYPGEDLPETGGNIIDLRNQN